MNDIEGVRSAHVEPKRKVGRPQKYNKEQLMVIYNDFSAYIDSNDDPTLAGFAVASPTPINKQFLLDRKEFSFLVKKAIEKQEQFLLQQFKNPTLAIFRLKQPSHGYTDKTEVETRNLHLLLTPDETVSKDFTAFLKQKTVQSTSQPKNP